MVATPAPDARNTLLCLAVSLGGVLEELLEVGAEILPLLPSHCKAALLALARRQVCACPS